jgi:DNA-binding MarR family transcriptional regulator
MAGRTSGSDIAQSADDLEHASRVFFALTVQAMSQMDTSVSPAGLRALFVLDDHDDCTLGDLAERVPLSQSATSRMVDRLVSEGLVRRDPVAGDRRQRSLRLTAKGRALTRDLVRRRRSAIGTVARQMTRHDVEQLRAGLQAFTASASAAAE